jgi:LPS export ABC transporter protein LptC
VFLEGDVRLTGRNGSGTKPAVITTEQMKLDVDRSIASTSAPVRIELAPHAVTARGLRADLKQDRVQLESSVNGRFTR